MPVTGPVRISAVLSKTVVELCLGCLAGQNTGWGSTEQLCVCWRVWFARRAFRSLCSGIKAVSGLGYFSGLFIMASYGHLKILLKTNPEWGLNMQACTCFCLMSLLMTFPCFLEAVWNFLQAFWRAVAVLQASDVHPRAVSHVQSTESK